jgi:hypothetical protein
VWLLGVLAFGGWGILLIKTHKNFFMKNSIYPSILIKKAIFSIVFLLYSLISNFAATCTWNQTNGNWSDASKWSCGSVPSSGDNVVISGGQVYLDISPTINNLDITANYVVLIGSGSITINGTFNMQANVAVAGDVIVNGTLNWGYTFQGSGNVICNGTTNIGPVSDAAIDGQTVTLNGGANWSSNILHTCCGAHLKIPVGQTVVHSGAAGNFNYYGSVAPLIEVLGTFQNTAGTMSSNVSINNSGTFFMQSGTFSTTGGSFTNSGILKGSGTLNLNNIFTQNGTIAPGNSPGILTFASLPSGTTNTNIVLIMIR